jgi:hypothetical protein
MSELILSFCGVEELCFRRIVRRHDQPHPWQGEASNVEDRSAERFAFLALRMATGYRQRPDFTSDGWRFAGTISGIWQWKQILWGEGMTTVASAQQGRSRAMALRARRIG